MDVINLSTSVDSQLMLTDVIYVSRSGCSLYNFNPRILRRFIRYLWNVLELMIINIADKKLKKKRPKFVN